MSDRRKGAGLISFLWKAVLAIVVIVLLVAGGMLAQQSVDTPDRNAKKDIKYVFLFIGDGMGLTHVEAAQKYSGEQFSFTQMDVHGVVNTDNAYGEVTDSAAAATAMACGKRTANGVLCMSKNFNKTYDTILKKLKKKGWHTGIVTTTPINHATPAAFYAHVKDRKDYYNIGRQAIENGTVDYLAGGAFEEWNKKGNDLYALAKSRSYTVLNNSSEVLNSPEKRNLPVIIALKSSYNGRYMEYELDRLRREERGDNVASLPKLVRNGISTLGAENRFFMVVESGMIDSASHCGDVGSALAETEVLDQSVQEALKFADNHKDETLILVTSDHESGSLTVMPGSDVSIYNNQKISFSRFKKLIEEIIDAGFQFDEGMKRIKKYFNMGNGAAIPLSSKEIGQLQKAYQEAADSKNGKDSFVNLVFQFMQKKSKISFASKNHTGEPVEIYAQGVGADHFGGWYNNTAIYDKLKKLLDF